MVDSGIDSAMRVARRALDDPAIRAGSGLRFRVANRLDRAVWRLQRSANDTWRSPAVFGSLSADEINRSAADVVNLHWVTAGFLSIAQIGRITKPVVWSLYDQWPFSGTEHYGPDSPQARWRSGYTRDNRPRGEHGIDIDRHAWERKRKHWRAGSQIVAASGQTTDAARQSALMGSWPISTIPHVVDCEAFSPMPMDQARAALGLPQRTPLILFLSSGGIGDARKGWDLLARSLPRVRQEVPDVEVVVVGPATREAHCGVAVHWRGLIAGDEALRLHYSAADVTAVPSREDNMPLTAMEAHSCGRAVTAFAVGGLTDIVEHQVTGHLAPTGDTEDLARGLVSALRDSRHDHAWGVAARARALRTWSREAVVPRYLEVYERALR